MACFACSFTFSVPLSSCCACISSVSLEFGLLRSLVLRGVKFLVFAFLFVGFATTLRCNTTDSLAYKALTPSPYTSISRGSSSRWILDSSLPAGKQRQVVVRQGGHLQSVHHVLYDLNGMQKRLFCSLQRGGLAIQLNGRHTTST